MQIKQLHITAYLQKKYSDTYSSSPSISKVCMYLFARKKTFLKCKLTKWNMIIKLCTEAFFVWELHHYYLNYYCYYPNCPEKNCKKIYEDIALHGHYSVYIVNKRDSSSSNNCTLHFLQRKSSLQHSCGSFQSIGFFLRLTIYKYCIRSWPTCRSLSVHGRRASLRLIL